MVHSSLYSVVMKPGGWLGFHSWDIRATSYTKGYFQVRDSETPLDHNKTMVNIGVSIARASWPQPIRCVSTIR